MFHFTYDSGHQCVAYGRLWVFETCGFVGQPTNELAFQMDLFWHPDVILDLQTEQTIPPSMVMTLVA